MSSINPLLCLLFAASLAACGGGSGASDPATADGGGSGSPSPSPAPGPSPSPAPVPTTSSVSLAWTAPADSRVIGYRVYYGNQSGTYVQARGAGVDANGRAALTIPGLTVGKVYYFAVTSYDASSNESDYSAEVTKTVQ